MHVAITGASSGIGEALVREYLAAGASVTLVARRRELMEKLAAEAGGKSQVIARDLGDPALATAWIAEAEAAFGPIDILVNNAGLQIVAPSAEVEPAALRGELELDLLTPLAIVHAVLPAMLARRAGTIVNVASLAALAPLPGMVGYNAAKAGLAAASESLRAELRGTGVGVVTVYPGPVDTPMARAGYRALPDQWTVRAAPEGRADVLARRVRRAVEKRRARVIYPWIYTFVRHAPGLTSFLIAHLAPTPLSSKKP